MKTKADAKVEAARLAIDSEAKDFTEKAGEIYRFLIEGINLPDTDSVIDPTSLIGKYFSSMPSGEKKDEEAK